MDDYRRVVSRTNADLTVIVPTRNRTRHLRAQLKFFKNCRLAYPIIVADSGDHSDVAAVHLACAGIAFHMQLKPHLRLVEKLAAVLASIETPFVVVTPDDDVALPHGIKAALEHLRREPSYVAAHGYLVQYRINKRDFDLHSVSGFTPTIGEDDPLQRYYHLMRRYQPFYWGVFRTDALTTSVSSALKMNGALFRELTVMNTAILQGKVARLPLVYGLRGAENSLTSINESHPLYWFLGDPDGFFSNYRVYRNAIAQFIRKRKLPVPKGIKLEHFLEIANATYLGRELDLGKVNHTAQYLLGNLSTPISVLLEQPGWHLIKEGDIVNVSRHRYRRYVWRKNILNAEPREEIKINAEEMSRVEQQLDEYVYL
jgi:glycosyltransferase domain-containing protein